MDNYCLILIIPVAFITNAVITFAIAFYGKNSGANFKLILDFNFFESPWGKYISIDTIRRNKAL